MPDSRSFSARLSRLSLVASLPLFVMLIVTMAYAGISVYLILLTVLFASVTIIYCHVQIYQKSAYQFRSLSNLLDAMVQGDYSLRARSSQNDDALNELIHTINGLADRLNRQRIESVESQLLLRTVINHIDVAIIALNDANEIILSNPAATKLLKLAAEPSPSDSLAQLSQLTQFGQLQSGESQVMTLTFGPKQGKFNIHMEEFREAGKQQKLLFITDVSTLLRSEERSAWQSLVRVISHEINNSLSPIASISQTLKRLLSRQQQLESHKDNLIEGLTIISQRANNLTEFVNSYKQISSLPAPERQHTSVVSLINKVIPLFQHHRVTVSSSDDVDLFIDPIQFEQVLINLIKNAVEAVESVAKDKAADGEIIISWQVQEGIFTLSICDDGVGISNPDNLFVPFYTTKNQGSGIGLVLCRQIMDVHGGRLSLTNRTDKNGCQAVIELPWTPGSRS